MAVVFIVAAIFFASIEPLIVKFGYNSFVLNPFFVIFFKHLVGGIVVIPLTSFLGNKFRFLGIAEILEIFKVSFLLLFTTSMMIISLKFIPAVVMLTIFTSTPAFVSIINFLKGRERVTVFFWIGFFIAFLGIMLLLDVFNRVFLIDGEFFLGVLLAYSGVLASSLYRTTLDDLTAKYTPIVVSTYIFLINSFVVSLLFLIFLFMGKIGFEMVTKEVYIGIYGGMAGVLANISFLYALNILGSTKVSILNMLQQPTIILLSSIFLKEKLMFSQIVGIILVLIGVNLAVRKVISQKK
ncbi:MAG: DMT family transporter [bacterium]